MRRTRIWMVALSALLMAAGLFIALAPYSLYSFAQGVASAILAVYGAAQLFAATGAPRGFRSPSLLGIGAVSVALGVALFAVPSYLTAGLVGIVLAILLLATGVERIWFSRAMKGRGIEGSATVTVLGALNVIAGGAMLFAPLAGGVVLSYLVAGYAITASVTLLIGAISMRRASA